MAFAASRIFLAALLVAITSLVLLALAGGPEVEAELALLRRFAEWRAANPAETRAVILLTHVGSGPVLLSLAALGAGLLLWRGRRWEAAALAMAVVGGRLGIDLVKLTVGRIRPAVDLHPVETYSLSFPSGHAGNSMITFLALALFAAPAHWRRPAVGLALLLAFGIGATRPVLGVHWPSDVLAGWIYGAAVVSLAAAWLRRRQSGA
jgi:membrane-associated phospholipid phosphatase